MLSYRHGFHAGNFADVLKHTVLAWTLEALGTKDKGFLYLDTHAGCGRYDLRSREPARGGEHEDGIGRLWQRPDLPAPLQPYLRAVAALNRGPALRFYPGSPRIARHLLRPQDRMHLVERHPRELRLLAKEFAGDPQVRVEEGDGYQALKAQLPPRERRGLVLIDPAYERRDEVERVAGALAEAHRRWPTGLYCVWYPVQADGSGRRLARRIRDSGIRKVLRAELCVHPEDVALGLSGSGVLVVNPPWRLEAVLGEVLPWLWRTLRIDGGGQRLDWLVPE